METMTQDFSYYEIPLGSGSKAMARWDTLTYLLHTIIKQARELGYYDTANLLVDWRSSLGFRIKDAPHWTLELTLAEWEALSRGLRAIRTAPGSSMYQWLNMNKEARFNMASTRRVH